MTTTSDKLAEALRAINDGLRPLRLGGLALDDDSAAELTRNARDALAAYDAERATTAREPTGAHTPEPWSVAHWPDESGPAIIGPNGDERIADVAGNEDNDANARRIAACVNACVGIPTATLEGGRVVKVRTADDGNGAGTFERDLPPAVVVFTPNADVPMAASPECGHSACRQHWIDTGSSECVEDGA